MKPEHVWALAFLVVSAQFAPVLQGQALVGNDQIPGQQGFRLDDATLSAGYLTFGGQVNNPSTQEVPLSEYYGWASMTVGYAHLTPNTMTGVTYTPSFAGAFHFLNAKGFNQSISFQHTRKLRSKWNLYTSGSASDTSVEEMIFAPGSLTQLIGGSANIGSLSHLSSGGIPVSPLQALVFGSRMLTYQSILGAGYRVSDRLSLSFDGGFAGLETRDVSSPALFGVIPHSRSEEGDFMLSYALTPRTALLSETSMTWNQSAGAEYDVMSFSVGIERKLTQHWFASIMGGVGSYIPLSSSKDAHATSSYIVNGSVGYKGRTQTWAAIFSRTVGNSYGISAMATYAAQGSWIWSPSGSPWGVRAFVSEQRLTGAYLGSFSALQASAGVSRMLTRSFSVGIDYGYLKDSVGTATIPFAPEANSVRITCAWFPGHLAGSGASSVTNGSFGGQR